MKAAVASLTLAILLVPMAQADLRVDLQKKKTAEQAGTAAPKVATELPGQDEKGQVTRVSMGCEEPAAQEVASPEVKTCAVEKSGELARKARSHGAAPAPRAPSKE